MNKLSGLDAGFLYCETDRCPQHVAAVQLLELPPGMDVDTFIERLKQLLMMRIHLVPYLTNRLVDTPLQLDHPVWITDSRFDIDNHVLRCEVPAPGGRKQWEAAIEELHAQRLDRSRPLWRMVVLSGLEGGRIAYYNAVHHACMDGMAGQAAIRLLMDTGPMQREVEPAPNDFLKPHHYSSIDLMSGAAENFLKAQVRQVDRLCGAIDAGLRIQRREQGFGAFAESAPATRFNRSIGTARTYATGEIEIETARRIVKATGCTLNDLFLALCGGGIRRYLRRAGELPKESMIAGCPVSLRLPGNKAMNNQVTLMKVTLATNLDDPIRRLGAIADSSQKAKSVTADLAGIVDGNPVFPGLPIAMKAAAAFGEAMRAGDRVRVPFNIVVSNIPGPRKTLYSAGARMLTHYPVSIPVHGLGVNITVQRYEGTMFFAITACAAALPDPAPLRDDILHELATLQNTLWTPRTSRPSTAQRTTEAPGAREPARAA